MADASGPKSLGVEGRPDEVDLMKPVAWPHVTLLRGHPFVRPTLATIEERFCFVSDNCKGGLEGE
jgi:hypothetical protein